MQAGRKKPRRRDDEARSLCEDTGDTKLIPQAPLLWRGVDLCHQGCWGKVKNGVVRVLEDDGFIDGDSPLSTDRLRRSDGTSPPLLTVTAHDFPCSL
jgi:hypothetical protein